MGGEGGRNLCAMVRKLIEDEDVSERVYFLWGREEFACNGTETDRR